MKGCIVFLFGIACGFLCIQSAVSENLLEEFDAAFWAKIDAACETTVHFEPAAGDRDTIALKVLEYTPLGMRSYPMFPNAAKELLASPHFDHTRPTIVFVHGFIDNPALFSGQSFAVAYKIHGKYNVIALDSSKLIHSLYARSSSLVKYIGEALGVFLFNLVKGGVSSENIHLVGHSLGAHISGFAGKTFQTYGPNMKLPRITGMDPAGPCFSHKPASARLDKGDADFVDIIHTNIGVFGLNETIGHVDFYPNGGGLRQPGCIESVCSHNRVWQLYEESVNLKHSFIGVRCNSEADFDAGHCAHNEKAIMGMACPVTTRGTFYLKTGPIPIFGKGLFGLRP